MNKPILIIAVFTMIACAEKDTQEQNFEDFQTEYFHARQGEELDEACNSWYDDCVAAGYPEESCSARLEYCQDGDWGDEDREEREENEDREEREESASECQREARIAYEECINTGGSEEDCRNEYAQAYSDCEEEG